jgi:hypothetical protein
MILNPAGSPGRKKTSALQEKGGRFSVKILRFAGDSCKKSLVLQK